MHVNNFFVCGPKFTNFFSPNVGVVVDELFDLWIRSGDIRDQTRKLSEIAPDFERFSPSQILGGRASKNCTNIITPGSRHVVWIKICDDIPITPDVIDVHTLRFKPIFKFSRLKFLGEPRPSWDVR